MGKNKRRQFEHFDQFHDKIIMCDSQEECDFINWCSEAAELGIIVDYEYQPEPFQLFEPTFYINLDNKKRSLLLKHNYSADFIVSFNPSLSKTLSTAFKISIDKISNDIVNVYLDVKGTFQRNGGGRSFSLNQKWVYQKYNIYVQKLVPADFFKICGCPKNSFISVKTKKPRNMFKGYPTIQEKIKSC